MAGNGYREFVLDNGLRVIYQRTPTKTVHARLRIHHATANERDDEIGYAHFLEHLLPVSGTEKYSPQEAEHVIQKLGYCNFFTTLDSTTVIGDMMQWHLRLFLDFAVETVFRSRLDPKRVEQERQGILREIADDKSAAGFEDRRAYLKALTRNAPQGREVYGVEGSIETATGHDLHEFMARGYYPNNTDLVLAGGLPEDVEKVIARYFGKIKTGNVERFAFPAMPPLEESVVIHSPSPDLFNRDRPLESSAELDFSILAPPEQSPDAYTMLAIACILGGGQNPRLLRTLRYQNGLAYRVGTGYNGSHNWGVMQTQTNVTAAAHEKAVDLIFSEMARLQCEPVSWEELGLVKGTLHYLFAKELESNEERTFAAQKKIDTGITPAKALRMIGAITPEKILEAAQKYLPRSRDDNNYVLMIRDPLLKE